MIMLKRCLCYWLTMVILTFAVICLVSCRNSSIYQSNQSDIETLSVEIDSQKVAQIDLYWNYRTYTVRHENDSCIIYDTTGLINGFYYPCGKWSNDRTGSGDHITFYDTDKTILAEYYFIRIDGIEGIEQGIWSEEVKEKILFQKNGNQNDTKDMIAKIVERIINLAEFDDTSNA